MTTNFDTMKRERTLVVVKYGGLPSVDEWNNKPMPNDPLVWGGPGEWEINITNPRKGWYFVGVFDTSGLDTEAHQAKGPESFDFTLRVFVGPHVACHFLALQGSFEQVSLLFFK